MYKGPINLVGAINRIVVLLISRQQLSSAFQALLYTGSFWNIIVEYLNLLREHGLGANGPYTQTVFGSGGKETRWRSIKIKMNFTTLKLASLPRS